jgi:hypothetical protein
VLRSGTLVRAGFGSTTLGRRDAVAEPPLAAGFAAAATDVRESLDADLPTGERAMGRS